MKQNRTDTMKRCSPVARVRRAGFTLVELLIVIAILGILAGLLAWGVNAARISILKRAQKFEIENIASAVERYREKYGDYPPDGSSWPVMEAHLRKAFPNILISELNLLDPKYHAGLNNPLVPRNDYIRNDNETSGTHPLLSYARSLDPGVNSGRVMDPAEALVFFLGGFSSDPQKPLSGPGGPLKPAGNSFIYNTQRENAFFEFKSNRLTLSADGTVSTDETVYSEGVANDLLPVYIGAGPSVTQGGMPVVYFDSRTYQFSGYANTHTAGNVTNSLNCARPFIGIDVVATAPPRALPNKGKPAVRPHLYANARTFQLISAGYDNTYGCRPILSLLGSNPLPLLLLGANDGQRYELINGLFYEQDNPPPPETPYPPFYLEEFATEDLTVATPKMRSHKAFMDDNVSNVTESPTLREGVQ